MAGKDRQIVRGPSLPQRIAAQTRPYETALNRFGNKLKEASGRMPLFQTSTRYRALQQLALVQLFQHFHGGVAAVVVDIHVVLPGDAAKGDDPFRPDALLWCSLMGASVRLWSTVMWGYRLNCWNTMELVRRTSFVLFFAVSSSPSMYNGRWWGSPESSCTGRWWTCRSRRGR